MLWYEYHTHIKSDRLVLIQVENTEEFITNYSVGSLQQIVDWLNDTSLMRYSEQRHKLHTIQSQQEYLLKTFGGENLKRSLPSRYWLIFKFGDEKPVANDLLIGSITSYVNADREVDLGIMLGRDHGNGYAAEAMNMVINYFHQRRVARFTCGMHGENDAMYKLATTLGMKSYKDEGPYLYMDMTLPLPPLEYKEKRIFPVSFAEAKTETIIDVWKRQENEEAEKKKSLVERMRDHLRPYGLAR